MKKQIILTILFSVLFAGNAFGAELPKVENPTGTADTKMEEQKDLSQEEIQKTKKEILIEKLAQAKNEEERKAILLEEQKDRLFSKKTEKIFYNFDVILNKLSSVEETLLKNKEFLVKEGVDITFLTEKDTQFKTHFNLAKKYESIAWLKIQNIDFINGEKEYILAELTATKENLLKSKSEIKLASIDLKETISFVRGALSTLKK